jgi:hypothetical protein
LDLIGGRVRCFDSNATGRILLLGSRAGFFDFNVMSDFL